MSLVILQPSGNAGAREHYVDTVQNLVLVTDCESFLSTADFSRLRDAHPSGSAAMWGVTPGARDVNAHKWGRINEGDVALFASDKRVRASGVVSTVFRSADLARHLWGVDTDGDTWEYMYSLDEVRDLDIPYREFNRVVGYAENNVIQGFTVLDEDKSNSVLNYFELRSDRHVEDVDDEDFNEAVTGLDGPLDLQVKGWQRAEQSKARKRLLRGRAEGACRLCERKMSAEFLVAAHIKRRTSCTDEEKRDLDNVVMLCCKFGCDELFERGYVAVDHGDVIVRTTRKRDAVADAYSDAFVGRTINVPERQREYFAWHFAERFLS
jgi:hypothetical protein